MSIPQNMKSVTSLIIDGVDLYAVTNLIARVKQGSEDAIEIPLTVVDSNKALMPITRDQAEKLNYKKSLEVQILWIDENGMPGHTKIKGTAVDQILGGGFGD